MDTVCKDLGKTYPEILALRREHIIWHYFNAIERKKEALEEKNDFREYMLMLIQPEWYKKIEDSKKSEVFESTKVDLTPINERSGSKLTDDDLRKYAEEASNINKKVQQKYTPEPPVSPEEYQNPISFTENNW